MCVCTRARVCVELSLFWMRCPWVRGSGSGGCRASRRGEMGGGRPTGPSATPIHSPLQSPWDACRVAGGVPSGPGAGGAVSLTHGPGSEAHEERACASASNMQLIYA